MMLIEMREAAYEKAFGLLDEMKELSKQKKMVMCELEDAIYECYESSKQDDEYEREEDEFESDDQDIEMNLRNNRGMRRNMRMHHNDDREDEMNMRGYRSSRNMRKRNRMGRFV